MMRELCCRCASIVRVKFTIPDKMWDELATEQYNNLKFGSVWREMPMCVGCFTELADEAGIAWGESIKFEPVMGVSTPKPIKIASIEVLPETPKTDKSFRFEGDNGEVFTIPIPAFRYLGIIADDWEPHNGSITRDRMHVMWGQRMRSFEDLRRFAALALIETHRITKVEYDTYNQRIVVENALGFVLTIPESRLMECRHVSIQHIHGVKHNTGAVYWPGYKTFGCLTWPDLQELVR